MTQREFLTAVEVVFSQIIPNLNPPMDYAALEIEDCTNENIVAKAKEMIASLDSKNAKRATMNSKEKQATSARRIAVLEFLRGTYAFLTRDDISTGLGLTPSQVTAACTALIREGLVNKTEVKIEKSRKTAYRAVRHDDESEEIIEDKYTEEDLGPNWY